MCISAGTMCVTLRYSEGCLTVYKLMHGMHSNVKLTMPSETFQAKYIGPTGYRYYEHTDHEEL
jgi:hypothetical protein